MDRFMKACHKALELYELKYENRQPNAQPPAYMFVNVGYSLLKVVFDDIVWIEGLKDYVQIHVKSSPKPIMVRMSVKAIEEQLPQNNFIRIHKSFIISIQSISAIRKNSVFIDDKEFPVGETYRDVVDKLTRNIS